MSPAWASSSPRPIRPSSSTTIMVRRRTCYCTSTI
jgi:hypothetical protein